MPPQLIRGNVVIDVFAHCRGGSADAVALFFYAERGAMTALRQQTQYKDWLSWKTCKTLHCSLRLKSAVQSAQNKKTAHPG